MRLRASRARAQAERTQTHARDKTPPLGRAAAAALVFSFFQSRVLLGVVAVVVKGKGAGTVDRHIEPETLLGMGGESVQSKGTTNGAKGPAWAPGPAKRREELCTQIAGRRAEGYWKGGVRGYTGLVWEKTKGTGEQKNCCGPAFFLPRPQRGLAPARCAGSSSTRAAAAAAALEQPQLATACKHACARKHTGRTATPVRHCPSLSLVALLVAVILVIVVALLVVVVAALALALGAAGRGGGGLLLALIVLVLMMCVRGAFGGERRGAQ